VTNQLRYLGFFVALGLVGWSNGAMEAQAQAEESAQARSGYIEEVMVTSQKRVENVQTVPIAVTPITGRALDDMHAVDLYSLQGYLPNVQLQQFSNTPNGTVFHIRGMGIIEPDPYAGTTVTVVKDGIPQFFNMTSALDLFDIERIEVLRGPQGTLFGANSTGGVINVVTAQPTGELGGKAEVTMGNMNRLDIKGAIDFPITDSLAGKVSFYHHGRDGFHRSITTGKDMGERDVTSLRTYLKHDKGGDFDATLIYEYLRSRNGAPIVIHGTLAGEAEYMAPGTMFPGAALPMNQGPCTPGNMCRATKESYFADNSHQTDISNMDAHSMTLTMNWDTSIGEITSITGYKRFSLSENTDQDGTPALLSDTHRITRGWQFTQELRDAIQVSDRLDVIAGVFFITDAYDHVQNYRVEFAVPGYLQRTAHQQDNWQASVFLQGYYQITEKLRAQAGVRFAHEKTKMGIQVTNWLTPDGSLINPWTGFSPDTLRAIPETTGFSVPFFGDESGLESESWDNFGAKVGFDYQFNDDIFAFVYYARGFKSGGFVGRRSFPSQLESFDEETVDTVEIGFKSDLFDNRLRVNVAVFHNWYDQLQLPQIIFVQTAVGTTVNDNAIINAATAKTKGFEVEVTAMPMDGLTVNLSVGYLSAKYSDFPYQTGGTIVQLGGTDLQNAPEWTIMAGFDHVFRVGKGDARIGATYRYVDEKFNTSLLNTPRATIQATSIIDANLDWTPEDGSWTIGLWARNLTDNRYVASVFDAPGVIGLANLSNPREWGLTFKIDW
jgi:iron complex outermembrane receptor protein